MLLGIDAPPDSLEKAAPVIEILSAAQMRAADRAAIEGGVPSFHLMLAAGQAVAAEVQKYFAGHAVLVLAGPGNNGGDGFVAAMFLAQAGFDVTVMAMTPGWRLRGDARIAYKRAADKGRIRILDFKSRPDMPVRTVVIDAVFGTGLRSVLPPHVSALFLDVKSSGWPVLAVDIPSGVDSDTGHADPAAPACRRTVTFFRKKLGHVLMPGHALCGAVSVYDIGIGTDILRRTGFSAYDNIPALWLEKLPRRDDGGHKYGRGHVVVFGGGKMTGAARLASEAAMRAGAGLCTVVAPATVSDIYRKGAPHIMTEDMNRPDEFAKHLQDERRNSVVIGPGAGLEDRAGLRRAVLATLETGKPAVLDADALTCFEDEPAQLLATLHGNVVLTPHEGEFARVFHGAPDDVRLARAMTAAGACAGATLMLKGPDTIVAATGHVPAIHSHATPWLATAGSGDVLAGIIAGLMAQGMTAFDAACAGGWMHGEAAIRKGPGLVAPDVIDGLPQVIASLQGAMGIDNGC